MKKLLSLVLSCCLLCTPVLTVTASVEDAENKPTTDWTANWIWDDSDTGNTWMNFRKEVTLDQVPESVTARIAVDTRYWLTVNGEPVIFEGQLKRGPTPEDTYFDEVELAPYLHEGENTIAVQVWYWGPRVALGEGKFSQSFSDNSSGKGGFLFEADFGDQKVVSDKSWKVCKDAAYIDDNPFNEDQPNYRLPEYNVYYDARLEIGDWTDPDFDDSSWANATELGKAPCAPWNQLYERSIPQWKDYGLKEYLNMDAYRGNVTTEDEVIQMDLPYNAQITPYLKVKAPAGKKIEMRTEVNERGYGTVMNTYITKEGEQEFEALSWFNGQHVFYTIPAGVEIISLQYRETGYDTEFAGSFSSEDDFYNTLWQKAQRSLYINMRDNFMDCPDRERAQWWGDATNDMNIAAYAFDPSAFLLYEKGLDTMANYVDPETDVLQTIVPIRARLLEYPVQQLAGINGYWDYYMYSGNKEILEQMYDSAKNYLNLWKIGDDGLVVHHYGTAEWPDWGDNADMVTLENAWYYLALGAAKKMAAEIGRDEDIALYDARMQTLYRGYQTLWTEDGFRSNAVAQPDDRGNAIAVLAGLADETQYPTIQRLLKNTYNSSPYMEKYILDALCKMDLMEDAQARMKTRYTPMVEDDYTTLWEYWNKSSGTNNHGWSGGPLVTMSRYMSGVAPTAPGYSEYQIKPDMGELNQISSTVSTVKGEIKVDLKRDAAAKTFDFGFTSPANTTATIAIPRFVEENMTVSVGDTVVFANGAAADTVQGVTYTGNDSEYIYFVVQPGSWNFHAEAAQSGTAQEYPIEINGESGSILLNGTQINLPYTDTVAAGSELTVEAVPEEGKVFSGWSGSYASQDSTITIQVDHPVRLTANFKDEVEKQYYLVHIEDPVDSQSRIEYEWTEYTLPATIAVPKNENATITALDDTFINWGGSLFSTERSLTLTVTNDTTILLNAAYNKTSNFALGGNVTATNTINNSTWTNQHLTDGNLDTGMSTNVIKNVAEDGSITPYDITVDLKQTQTFDNVVLYPRTNSHTEEYLSPNFPREFTIQVSNDGETFTDVKQVVVDPNPNKTPVSIDFEVQTARYIRIHVTRMGDYAADESAINPYRVQLMELEVYNKNHPAEECTLSLDAVGDGAVRINGQLEQFPFSKSYPAGSIVSIEAVAATEGDFQFIEWTGKIETTNRPLYVQLNENINLTAQFKSMHEVEKVNLAAGKTVKANNSLNSSDWKPNYLTDGKTDSNIKGARGFSSNKYFEAELTSNQPWVEIDLGTTSKFNELVIYPRTDTTTADGETPNYPEEFQIQVMDENGDYQTVLEVTGQQASSIDGAQTYQFDDQTSRYIRIFPTKLGTPAKQETSYYRLQLAEIEVYNEQIDSSPVETGKITLTSSSDRMTVDSQMEVTATVENSSLEDNSLIWTVEDEQGMVSDVLSLSNLDTNQPTVTANREGSAYVVARFANGLPTMAKLKIEVEQLDLSILNAVITYAENAKASGEYDNAIESVQKSFDVALENAKAVAGNNTATQEQVDAAWRTLLNEIHKLGFVAGDKTALASLIEAANGINTKLDLYVEAGKAEFTAALEAAVGVYEDGDAMQAEVNTVADNLLNAMLNLRLKADKSILQQVIAEANGKNANAYTAESYAVLQVAVNEANAIMENENATQDEVDTAVTNVQTAMDNLVAVDGTSAETPTENVAQTGQESTTSKTNAAKTGDFAPIAGLAAIAFASGMLLFTRRKR